MESNKKYWKGLEELNNTPEFIEANNIDVGVKITDKSILKILNALKVRIVNIY